MSGKRNKRVKKFIEEKLSFLDERARKKMKKNMIKLLREGKLFERKVVCFVLGLILISTMCFANEDLNVFWTQIQKDLNTYKLFIPKNVKCQSDYEDYSNNDYFTLIEDRQDYYVFALSRKGINRYQTISSFNRDIYRIGES